MNKRLVAGAAICLPALVLGGLFFVESYHEVYRSSPPVFVLITLLGAFCPLAGGLLSGRALAARREARSGALQRFLFSAGFVVTIAGIVLGESRLSDWRSAHPVRVTGVIPLMSMRAITLS
jgi:hypothetical protein